jgi:hypothetical protein
MDCMRINCAHDDAGAWTRMLQHLRRAEQRHRRSCRVLMDLAGPKVRTGPVEPGPAVVKFGPRRDALGRVTDPARSGSMRKSSRVPHRRLATRRCRRPPSGCGASRKVMFWSSWTRATCAARFMSSR